MQLNLYIAILMLKGQSFNNTKIAWNGIINKKMSGKSDTSHFRNTHSENSYIINSPRIFANNTAFVPAKLLQFVSFFFLNHIIYHNKSKTFFCYISVMWFQVTDRLPSFISFTCCYITFIENMQIVKENKKRMNEPKLLSLRILNFVFTS